MTTTTDLPRTAARSHQLVAASERTTLDPFRDIDWSIPIDDSAMHLPPETLPLYGTEIWDSMSDAGRIAYSRHECAALCGAGIWFENVLMQAVLRHLAEMPTSAVTRRCSASSSGAPERRRIGRRTRHSTSTSCRAGA
jgi:P-aminobenzoate N-oxygenase AurF